jgi:hypothetical protein
MGHKGQIITTKCNAARATLALCATTLFLLVLAPSAVAAPSHPRLAAQDITGLNHACGAAVDSKGDVYASSAGESKVKVFNPAHTELTSITNANEPCGLAVDTKGNLYVSEAKTGHVVKYHPTEYPFVGTPSYEAPVTIDASGKAKGIAVDPFDNSLYVAEGNRISNYQSNGTLGIDEVQEISVAPETTGGTFTLTFAGQTTAPIPYNAGAATVQSALEALSNIAPGDVSLSGGPGATSAFLATFGGTYAATDVPQIEPHSALSPNQVEKLTVDATAGTYTLKFAGQTTAPIEYNAPAGKGEGSGSVEAALEALSNIAPGDVSLSGGPGGPGGKNPYIISFEGAYAGKSVTRLERDQSALTGTATVVTTTFPGSLGISTTTQGWSGHIGEGDLTEATGVAAYTYPLTFTTSQRYVFAAEPSKEKIQVLVGADSKTLAPRAPIDGAGTPAGALGLGSSGASLGIDPLNGHLYAYDATHGVLNEFGASGHYFTQIVNPAFADAKPTAIAVDRSGGAHDGTVYVTAGAGAGAKLLAFGPVAAPSRATLGKPPAQEIKNACGTVVDSAGDIYVAGETTIQVYDSSGSKLTSIADPSKPCSLAVDSAGNLYAANNGKNTIGDESVAFYEPQQYPPKAATAYSAPKTIETTNEPKSVAVNPANDHLYVTHGPGGGGPVVEYNSAKNGSGILNSNFGGIGAAFGIDVYGANGDVYVASVAGIHIFDPSGSQVAEINGTGSPAGPFGSGGLNLTSIAVDQSNGDVLVGTMGNSSRNDVEEYEPSGAPVAQYGPFTSVLLQSDIAVDNSAGPTKGNLYVAYRNNLTAFGPLNYGEGPVEPKEFKLSVTKSGTGSGTVTSIPAGINCGEDCSEVYEEATVVTLEAKADSGSTFTGWSGACTGTGPCKVTMSEAKSVTAEFTKEVSGPVFHKLTISVTGNGSVSANTGTISGCTSAGGSSCEGEYEQGAKVTLSETPGEGSLFAGWGTLQCDESTQSTCEVMIGSGDEGVTASFLTAQTLKVATEGEGTITSSPGLISCSPFCEDSFAKGIKVTLTATPAPGAIFIAWKHCDSGGVIGGHCTVAMDKAKAVTAVFASGHALTVKSSGLGKVQSYPVGISCLYNCQSTTAAYNATTKVTLKATPARHFHFDGFSGDCEGTGTCEVSMGADREVKALFTPNTKFSLTLTRTGAGKGIVRSHPAGINCGYTCISVTASYDEGEEVALEVSKVALGSSFGGWSGGGCSGTTPTCTVAMDEAKEVKAEFK